MAILNYQYASNNSPLSVEITKRANIPTRVCANNSLLWSQESFPDQLSPNQGLWDLFDNTANMSSVALMKVLPMLIVSKCIPLKNNGHIIKMLSVPELQLQST